MGSEAKPVSYSVVNGDLSAGAKQAGREADHLPSRTDFKMIGAVPPHPP